MFESVFFLACRIRKLWTYPLEHSQKVRCINSIFCFFSRFLCQELIQTYRGINRYLLTTQVSRIFLYGRWSNIFENFGQAFDSHFSTVLKFRFSKMKDYVSKRQIKFEISINSTCRFLEINLQINMEIFSSKLENFVKLLRSS